jgi:hypothetical protein
MRYRSSVTFNVAVNDFHELGAIHAWSDHAIIFGAAVVCRAIGRHVFGPEDIFHRDLFCFTSLMSHRSANGCIYDSGT